MQNVDSMQTGAAVAHFLNCLLAVTSQSTTQSSDTAGHDLLLQQRKSNKKSKRKTSLIVNGWDSSKASGGLDSKKSSSWKKLSQKILWKELAEDALHHYGCKLTSENCDQFMEWSGTQKFSLLRRFCIIVGVQLQLKV